MVRGSYRGIRAYETTADRCLANVQEFQPLINIQARLETSHTVKLTAAQTYGQTEDTVITANHRDTDED